MFTRKVMDEVDPRDARQPIAQPGSTLLQHVERKYHRAVEAQGLKRVRERAEWFEGDLGLIEKAMRSIGSGTFYRFENNKVVLKERLRGDSLPKTVKAKHTSRRRALEPFHAAGSELKSCRTSSYPAAYPPGRRPRSSQK